MDAMSQNKTLLLSLLQQGKLAEAQRLISIFDNISEGEFLEKAEVLFLKAKIEIYSGKYSNAISLLETSFLYNPRNITVVCDLALCQYQLGLYGVLAGTLDKAKELIQEQIFESKIQNTIDNSILISKLMSEQGSSEDALVFLETISTNPVTSKQAQSLDIQRLRLSLEYGDLKQAQILYAKILGGTGHTLNFEVEREHCLLLADCHLLGVSQALDRFEYLMEQDLLLEDRYFLSSEMVEQLVLAGRFEEINRFKLNIDSESEYEKQQAYLIKSTLEKKSISPISFIRMEKVLSPMNLIRLMRQVLILFPKDPNFEKTSDKYRFYCNQLSSKKMKTHFLQFLIKSGKELKVVVNSSVKSVEIDGKSVSIKSSLFWKLLSLFEGNRKDVSIEEAIQHLYQEIPNLQHFDRLRIGVSRLNQNIKESSNIEALFKVSKTSISLLHQIEGKAS